MSTGNLTDADASLIWEQLSQCLDALVAAWQQAEQPPDLCQFLPAGPPAVRRLTPVEAVKVDLEYRWQQQRWPKRIEEYVAEFPELAGDDGVPCDIIYEEYHIRKQRGDTVSIPEYLARFPTRVDELKRLFNLEAPDQTTSLVCAEAMPTFEVGQKIDDFDLISSLGKGAFATVFLARQLSMQRLVALKVSRDRGFEHQTLAQLDHPNIVRVYDQRQLPEQKIRLLYMQYVAGGTLQGVAEHARSVSPASRSGATLLAAVDQALAKRGEQVPGDSMTRYRLQRASWADAVCWVGARLASALDYAHGRGVLHRDVKPANVLVGADGHPKLADFNISFSKLDGATPAAYFGGSLAYMSPEQLEACDPAHARQPDELDGRSDVYSLGVLLWELLTGKRPFAEDGMPKNWSQALAAMTELRRAGVPPEAKALVPASCPRMVVDVLLRCLEPDVNKRYGSAAEMAKELDLCLQPRAHALLHQRADWAGLLKRHPVVSTILIGLLPNVILSVLNIKYNLDRIMNGLSAEDRAVFMRVLILGINGFSYSVGLGYVFITRGPLFTALVRLARGEKVEPHPGPQMVNRCLTFGTNVAVITAILWSISGVTIPAWIRFGAGDDSGITTDHYLKFFTSQVLCGMIAATQSYYAVTFLSVRYCYPWLLQARQADTRDVNDLAGVARRGKIFLALTVLVPLLALPALAISHTDQEVIAALGGIGLVGCGIVYYLDLAIRADLAALAAAMNPSGDSLMSGDTLDSFLTGTRR